MDPIRRLIPLVVLAAFCGLPAQEPPSASDTIQLAFVLKSARRYCARLERAALDFVCLEEVSEVLDPSRDRRDTAVGMAPIESLGSGGPSSQGGFTSRGNQGRLMSSNARADARFANSYLYDYQFIRRDGKVQEKRVLLERNGRKAGPKTPNPRLMAFNFADILLAPVQLLDQRFEEYYAFRLLRKEKLGEADAWVLEVAPRLSGGARYLGGRIWLKADDSSVLRIEWDPATFGYYECVLARAEVYKSTPAVRSYSEFGVEKNGLRFPSLDVTEEAYRGPDGKLFVRARTSVLYRDHKFFTVETQAVVNRD